VVAVDVADQPVDVVAQDAVLVDRSRDGVATCTKTRPRRRTAVGDQLAERTQPGVDALGVVEPVDPEEHLARVAELLADLVGRAPHRSERASSSKPRCRSRSGTPSRHDPAVGQVDLVAVGLVPDPLADQADEVLRAAGQLEADQVGAEQPSRICRRHGSCWNSSAGGNGMCR
jgi:hypothetical protein